MVVLLKLIYCRGNTPFCSQECRQEQIEVDEGRKKKWKVSSFKRSTSKVSKKSVASTKAVQTGSIVVA